ncbi:MAG: Mn2+/Fe2+ NRAMP family transporter, partial [Candidatus Krumholzibacteriia bacterium]
ALGPGILFAGAAIGVSHLVQSTRAGATYGFGLLWAVLLVLVCKYPFFEFAHRYTIATGQSLLSGYARLGRWALILFMLVVVLGAFITTAAVTVVTSGLMSVLLGSSWSLTLTSAVLLAVIVLLIGFGHYRMLDRGMKVMVVVLSLLTLAAVGLAVANGQVGDPNHVAPNTWSITGLTFLLALMGWMPAPLEIGAWSSLWILEKDRETPAKTTMDGALFDFHVGYFAAAVLAVAFVCFGALIMFGTGTEFSASGVGFANQLVQMYTAALGSSGRWVIALVAFITMFSTTITVIDGYSRTLDRGLSLLWAPDAKQRSNLYALLLATIALVIIAFFVKNMKTLVDVVTILAFLTAPLVATLNLMVVRSPEVPASHRPGRGLLILSGFGLLFLTGFSLVWIWLRWLH